MSVDFRQGVPIGANAINAMMRGRLWREAHRFFLFVSEGGVGGVVLIHTGE